MKSHLLALKIEAIYQSILALAGYTTLQKSRDGVQLSQRARKHGTNTNI